MKRLHVLWLAISEDLRGCVKEIVVMQNSHLPKTISGNRAKMATGGLIQSVMLIGWRIIPACIITNRPNKKFWMQCANSSTLVKVQFNMPQKRSPDRVLIYYRIAINKLNSLRLMNRVKALSFYSL